MKTKKFKIKSGKNNALLIKRVTEAIEKKKTVNQFIKDGKDLKSLNERGIKLRMPV